MALPKKQWDKIIHSEEVLQQEREWNRLNSVFPPRDLPFIWITPQHDYGASEDIKQRVAAIIHPKLPISP